MPRPPTARRGPFAAEHRSRGDHDHLGGERRRQDDDRRQPRRGLRRERPLGARAQPRPAPPGARNRAVDAPAAPGRHRVPRRRPRRSRWRRWSPAPRCSRRRRRSASAAPARPPGGQLPPSSDSSTRLGRWPTSSSSTPPRCSRRASTASWRRSSTAWSPSAASVGRPRPRPNAAVTCWPRSTPRRIGVVMIGVTAPEGSEYFAYFTLRRDRRPASQDATRTEDDRAEAAGRRRRT